MLRVGDVVTARIATRNSLDVVTGTPVRRSAPRARVSAGALQRNAILAVAAAGDGAVADLRRDGYGHGAREVAAAAFAAGARAALVDASSADAAHGAGLEGICAAGGAPILDPTLLFGLSGSPADPAMSLAGPVLSTKRLRAGEGVSYGYIHRAPADTHIALVAGGYAEGVVRALGSAADVEIAGRRCPIVGRVAMDVCVVDIGDADVRPGAEAVYFGAGGMRYALADWAAVTGFEPYELAASVGLHVAREAVA